MDENGHVDAVDGEQVLQREARLINSLTNTPGADVNHDGHVNTMDASLILQSVAGLVRELDCDGHHGHDGGIALILRYDAGLIRSLPTAATTDANGDDVITSLDALLISQRQAGR